MAFACRPSNTALHTIIISKSFEWPSKFQYIVSNIWIENCIINNVNFNTFSVGQKIDFVIAHTDGELLKIQIC